MGKGLLDSALKNQGHNYQINTGAGQEAGIIDRVERDAISTVISGAMPSELVSAQTQSDQKAIDAIVTLLRRGNYTNTKGTTSSVMTELKRAAPKFYAQIESSSLNAEELNSLYYQVVDSITGIGLIRPILSEYPTTTDIGYDGRYLTVETNTEKFVYAVNREVTPKAQWFDSYGVAYKTITDSEIVQLVSLFATRQNKSFTETSPIFDGFSENLRISATHSSLSADGTTTMSLRFSRPQLALTEKNFYDFAPMVVYRLLGDGMVSKSNMSITGETGTGKTELLKLLTRFIPFSDRIVMIEDIAETQFKVLYPEKEVFDWLTSSKVDIGEHVKNAMRNNPTWLMVSETRGKEANDMFQAVLSGHALLTTFHSLSNSAAPARFTGMASSAEHAAPYEQIREDFLRYMHFGIHITKRIFSDGRKLRYLDELVMFTDDPKYPNGCYVIYKQRLMEENGRIYRYDIQNELPDELTERLRDYGNITSTKYWADGVHTEESRSEVLVESSRQRQQKRDAAYAKNLYSVSSLDDDANLDLFANHVKAIGDKNTILENESE